MSEPLMNGRVKTHFERREIRYPGCFNCLTYTSHYVRRQKKSTARNNFAGQGHILDGRWRRRASCVTQLTDELPDEYGSKKELADSLAGPAPEHLRRLENLKATPAATAAARRVKRNGKGVMI
jgi:hypothetical protein